MTKYLTLVLAMMMMATLARAADTGSAWEIHGRIVDSQGMPVEEFEAASFWSSNGKQWDESGEWIKTKGFADAQKLWKEEGELVAYPHLRAVRKAKGEFSLAVNSGPRTSIFATDKRQQLGGMIVVEKNAATKPVTITLAPLVRVHGKIFCSEADRTPGWTMAVVHPPGDRENYLHFTQCGSLRGEFSFLLPPGKFDLDVYSVSPSARMAKPAERAAKDAPPDMPAYLSGIRIEVPPQATLDLGVLDVMLPKDKSGVARDYTQFYGKHPPELAITDARGARKDIKLADFRGKWILLDFWAVWCGPCIHKSLPKLTRFYEEHAADRGRFEILAICNTEQEECQTIDDFDKLTASAVEKVWGGKRLPFPVLIDGEGKTYSAYGIQQWPTVLLIDPEGRLVKDGDEQTLAEKLEQSKP